jgi:hypothetical protein
MGFVVAASSSVVEEFNKGKAVCGISRSHLIDSSAPNDWGVADGASGVDFLGVEE